jgi:5-methylcytosine-specific restriction protein A
MKAGEEEESGAGHPKDQKEARRLAWHLRAEGRNSAAARAAKKHHGHVCQVCAFDFEKAYGPLGHQYIEAHHLTPFSELDERPKKIDPATDYAVVCSNCHRMLHRRLPPLTPAELKSHLQ